MMIDRKKEINSFLKKLTKHSNQTSLTAKQIYYELIFNNIPPEKRVDLSEFFVYWQQKFSNDSRIRVFVDQKHEFFCQFVDNNSQGDKSNLDPVKIYLSLKPDYLAQGVNQIFTFLTNNNIQHQSKVGRILRTDNIVIRVYNLNDAKKLIDFINKNKFLVKGYSQIPPFCFKDGIVGLAMDNYHSYNSIVCNLISKYLEYKKNLHQLDTVNCQDLCEFVRHYDLRQAFANGNADFIKSYNDILFVEEIKNLFIKSLSSSNLNDFYQHYYSVTCNQHLVHNNNNNNSNSIIDDLLFVMNGTASKYDEMQVYRALSLYLLHGNSTGFTRVDAYGNPCRIRITKYDHSKVCQEIYRIFLGTDTLSPKHLQNLNNIQTILQLANYFYGEIYQKNSLKK